METKEFYDPTEVLHAAKEGKEYFFVKGRKEFFELQQEFFGIAKGNLASKNSAVNTAESFEEFFAETMEEVSWQINEWYNGCSYYPKPEDILVDFFFLTPEQAHRFLPIFKGGQNV